MTASKPKPAVAYLRVSTDRQLMSIEDQRTAIRRYADAEGFEVLHEYVDDAVSGTSTAARKAFLQLISHAQASGHDWRHVLVYDIKRFGRVDVDEAGHHRYLLRQAGVEVVYVSENFNGDDTDDLLRPVKQWQARQESRDLSKVTIRGQVSLSEHGWWIGGTPPFGYDLLYFDSANTPQFILRFLEDGSKEIRDPQGNLTRTLPKGERLTTSKKDRARLVLSAPERVAVVQRIFEMYVGGLGYRTIARRLNAEGIPSPRNGSWAGIHDGHWAVQTIRVILTNGIYAGDMIWNRRTAAKFHRIVNGRAVSRSSISAGKWGRNEEEDWVVVRDSHTPIIERVAFERAQEIRRSREGDGPRVGYRRGRGTHSPFLLSGLVRCEACGHAFQGYTTTKSKARRSGEKVKTLYYCCGGYIAKGNTVCRRVLFRQDALDEYVLREIGVRVNRFLAEGGTALLREVVARLFAAAPDDPRPEMARLRKRLIEIESKADELLEMMNPANQDFVERKLAKLRRERTVAESRIEELGARSYTAPDVEGVVETIIAALQDFPRVVAQGTPEERKTFVRAFVTEIRLHPHEARGTVRIKKIPLPVGANSGNSSLIGVAGVRYELEKNGFGASVDDAAEIDELLRVIFERERVSLVPA